jgi:hypothetical protein
VLFLTLHIVLEGNVQMFERNIDKRKRKLEFEWKILLLQHLIKSFMWQFGFKYENLGCVGSFSKFQYWCHKKEKAMLAIDWRNYSWFLQYMNNDNGNVCNNQPI